MKALLSIILLAMATVGFCGKLHRSNGDPAEYQVKVEEDRFHPGHVTINGDIIRLLGRSKLDELCLQPLCSQNDSTAQSLTWLFLFVGPRPAFFESLDLLYDGRTASLHPPEPPTRDHLSGGVPYEAIFFNIPDELFFILSNADSVSFRLNGERQIRESDLNSYAKGCLKKYYETVLSKRTIWVAQ
jgi:hypothetical protein